MMKNLLKKLQGLAEIIRDMVVYAIVGVSLLYVSSAIVAFPVVMAVNHSWWWLAGYVGYFILGGIVLSLQAND